MMGENDEETDDDEDDNIDDQQKKKYLTKIIIDRAFEMTNSIPDNDIIGTMHLKKSKYMHDLVLARHPKRH